MSLKTPYTQENRIATILIIDDNPHNLRMISDFLEDANLSILVAEDGESGLERARYAMPDIILLGILMPGFDGFEICRQLKADSKTREIPVILITSASDTDHKVKSFQSGATDYITKPFQKEEVLARLMVHLRIRDLTAKLLDTNESLEHRVAERTAQLVRANQELEKKVSDIKHTKATLEISEQRLKAIFNQSHHFVGLIALTGEVVDANQSSLSFAGISLDDVMGKPFWHTPWFSHSPVLQEKLRKSVQQAANGELVHFDASHIATDASLHAIDFSLKPVRDEFGNVTMLMAEGRDISELKQTAQDLAASRNHLDQIINAIADPIFVKDRRHRWVMLNDACCNFIGHSREELMGKSDYDFFPKSEADEFWAKDEIVFTTGKKNTNEEKFTDAEGTEHTILTNKALYTDENGAQFIVGTIRDITEQKNVESQLRQAVKMEAIGTLAGGIAHDFNNLMTAVIGYSNLLQGRVPTDSPLRKDIENINRAGERAAALTHQLLAFSRKQMIQPKVLDLNAILTETKKLLDRLIGEDIELNCIFGADLWRILCDPGLAQQIIMNLAVNARDAMPKGGKLTIETVNADLDETYAQHHLDVEPGRYVLLAVSDTGAGMNPETQSHIFEPFFTTKEKGRGTGLGLATVYGIIKQSGGHIWVYSEPGKGTTFKVYLPESNTEPATTASDDAPKSAMGGSETILVVEDDDTVRFLAKEILLKYGYQVMVVSSGKSALQLLDQHDGTVELVITDVVMPEMGGRQVAESVASRSPGTKILYMSGYTDNAIVHHGVLEAGVPFIQKPFSPLALAEKVRTLLDEPPHQ